MVGRLVKKLTGDRKVGDETKDQRNKSVWRPNILLRVENSWKNFGMETSRWVCAGLAVLHAPLGWVIFLASVSCLTHLKDVQALQSPQTWRIVAIRLDTETITVKYTLGLAHGALEKIPESRIPVSTSPSPRLQRWPPHYAPPVRQSVLS